MDSLTMDGGSMDVSVLFVLVQIHLAIYLGESVGNVVDFLLFDGIQPRVVVVLHGFPILCRLPCVWCTNANVTCHAIWCLPLLVVQSHHCHTYVPIALCGSPHGLVVTGHM